MRKKRLADGFIR
jgi:hypothetical protein